MWRVSATPQSKVLVHFQSRRRLCVLCVSAVSTFRPVYRRAAEDAEIAQRRIIKLNQYPIQQALVADGAIVSFSTNRFHCLNAEFAPQLKRSVGAVSVSH